jgi:hypothetical protein
VLHLRAGTIAGEYVPGTVTQEAIAEAVYA